MQRRELILLAMTAALVSTAVASSALDPAASALESFWDRLRRDHTVQERLEQYAPVVEKRLRSNFEARSLAYPPSALVFVAFKDTRALQVYGKSKDGSAWTYVRSYPVTAASGAPGPKLVEGDRQVPEGIYAVEALNPNSRFHLSIRLNYPNDFDRRMAESDHRSRLGSDIMIHGDDVSVGCLAVGNDAAEDLFVLAALAGIENVRVIISPTDFRKRDAKAVAAKPVWVHDLYEQLREELRRYPSPA